MQTNEAIELETHHSEEPKYRDANTEHLARSVVFLGLCVLLAAVVVTVGFTQVTWFYPTMAFAGVTALAWREFF